MSEAPPNPGIGHAAATPSGEPLLATCAVQLFGVPFAGLTLGELGVREGAQNGFGQHLRRAMASTDAGERPQLARIFAVLVQGVVYPTPEQPIMLVFGPGAPVAAGSAPPEVPHGAHAWTADRMDMGVRIDLSVGWLQDVLLAEAMSCEVGDLPEGHPMRGRALGHSVMQQRGGSVMTQGAGSTMTQRGGSVMTQRGGSTMIQK